MVRIYNSKKKHESVHTTILNIQGFIFLNY